MTRIESAVLIPRSIEEVFEFLNRCESHLKFIPRMVELNQTSQGAFGQVGTRLSGLLDYFGIRIPVQYELIEVEPIHRLAMKGQMGPVDFRDGYTLSRAGDSTQVNFWLELIPTGWLKLMKPFAGLIGRIHAYETLRNLKRELNESQ